MKLLVVFTLFSGFMFSQSINLSESVVNFGTITKGNKAERNILITNTGNSPLIITNVKSSCGCTVASKPNKPIMPGKSDEISISYDTHKVGVINKVVEVFSNDKVNARKVIRVKGNIK